MPKIETATSYTKYTFDLIGNCQIFQSCYTILYSHQWYVSSLKCQKLDNFLSEARGGFGTDEEGVQGNFTGWWRIFVVAVVIWVY